MLVAQSDRRFYRRHPNTLAFAVAAAVAIAVGVLTYQPIVDVQSTERESGNNESGILSPRCLEADRAAVAQLATVLERNKPVDAAILERANFTLSIARRHCFYGWNERALEDYEWLKRWLSEQR